MSEWQNTPPDPDWEAHAIFEDICGLQKDVASLAEQIGVDLNAGETEFVHPLGAVAERLFEARAFMAEFLNDEEETK